MNSYHDNPMLQKKKMCGLKQGQKKERNTASKSFLASSAVFSIAVLVISIQIASGRETDLKKPIYDGNDEGKAFAPSTSRYTVSKPESLTTTTHMVGRKNRTLKSSKSKGRGSSKGSSKGKGGTYCGDPSRHFQFYRDFEVFTEIHSVEGDSAADEFGEDVSISGDGKVVAVGASNIGEVKIYSDPTGSGSFSQLNVAGNILAIGAPQTGGNNGYVNIYEWDTDTSSWSNTDVITGEELGDNFGFSVDLSDDGTILAIGAPNADGSNGGIDVGEAYIYQGPTPFTLRSPAVEGPGDNDYLGYSVSLNFSGKVLAAGAPGVVNVDDGYVNLYEYSSGSYIQGSIPAVTGTGAENFGTIVSLNYGGYTIVVGAPANDDAGTDAGKLYTYQYRQKLLSWVGSPSYTGRNVGDKLGKTVVMAAIGDRLIPGSQFYGG